MTATPWGISQDSKQLERGLVWYSTPGHGGVAATVRWAQANMSPEMQCCGERYSNKLWFEEDCAICAVFFARPDLYFKLVPSTSKTSEEVVQECENTLRRYFPFVFDSAFQAKIAVCGYVPPAPEPGSKVQLGNTTYTVTKVVKKGWSVTTASGVPLLMPKGQWFMYAERVISPNGITTWENFGDQIKVELRSR